MEYTYRKKRNRGAKKKRKKSNNRMESYTENWEEQLRERKGSSSSSSTQWSEREREEYYRKRFLFPSQRESCVLSKIKRRSVIKKFNRADKQDHHETCLVIGLLYSTLAAISLLLLLLLMATQIGDESLVGAVYTLFCISSCPFVPRRRKLLKEKTFLFANSFSTTITTITQHKVQKSSSRRYKRGRERREEKRRK